MIHTITFNPGIDVTLRLQELKPGGVQRPDDVSEQPGGKGMNVSMALARLGVDTRAWVLLGGRRGEAWKDLASNVGFEIQAIEMTGETRQNIKVFETGLNRQTDLNLPGPSFEPEAFDHLLSGLAREVGENDLVVVAGSSLPDTPPETWVRLGKILRGNGARLVIDVSGEPLKSVEEFRPWMVKINLDEYNEWKMTDHRSLDSVVASMETHDLPHHLLLTDGGNGALGISSDGSIERVGCYEVEVQGTVGAGDAFTAGFLAAWEELDNGWRNALAWGAATAAGAVELPGTDFPTRERVLEILMKEEEKDSI
ncbi:MAG: 1-phosphofructokinase family hexose kinase [Candidatus Omnitrophica bacterium]|nr:1-phosphofructokinase family hexose kinase [Candidatus Omnitrophota bacterium]